MISWKERIVMMLMVRNEMQKADVEQLWEYHYPEIAANSQDIVIAQERLNIKLSDEYIDFLLHANGWKSFYQTVDLLGTRDFSSDTMAYAKKMIDIEAEHSKYLSEIKEFLFPVAVSKKDRDLFVMVLKKGEEHGQILWLAGGEVERFYSFEKFFDAMIAYNKEELDDMISEATASGK